MNKRIQLAVVLLTILLCICGCTFRSNAFAYTQIQQVTVEFDVDDQTHRSVQIDFTEDLKTVTDYTGSSRIESAEEFTGREALRSYLDETVIPGMADRPEQKDETSEEQLAWRVKIVTDGGNLIDSGVGDAPVPEYWETLLALIGE